MAQLAITGGPKTKSKPFPSWPQFDDSERQALLDVLDSGNWWRTAGDKTTQFERDFAAFHGAKHGIAVTNGTHAIEIAIEALDIRFGDEVIMPDFTFIATASAVLSTGALPVLVDVEPRSYCIDPDAVEAAITRRTKAIIAVHMGGHPCDMDRLTEIAEHHNLLLIEDCAHAHASEWRGKRVGTFGVAGTFSFQASKTMTAGEGGFIVTNDDAFERQARSVHDCGRLPGHHFYEHFGYGSNYRLSEWQGAVLCVQLTRLDAQTALRDKNARLLDSLLSQIDGITPQRHDERCTRNGHYLYLFHYACEAFKGVQPRRFIEALNAEGIPTQATYPPIHALEVFQSGAYKKRLGKDGDTANVLRHEPFHVSQRVLEEVIGLPQATLLGDEDDIHEIAQAVEKVQRYAHEL